MTRLYVVAPMSYIPRFNYPAIAEAQGMLEEAGYDVVTPIGGDTIDVRQIAWESEAGDPAELPDGFLVDAVRRNTEDLIWCDGVARLDGWDVSLGALHEVALARRLGRKVDTLSAWIGRAS